uniref:Uncharacterized protein n=1 Tax=Macaca nemestrina TaxID=9545 RepID=A0A2K6APU9_MACNE
MGGTKGAQVHCRFREDYKGLGRGDCKELAKTQRGPAIKAPNFKGNRQASFLTWFLLQAQLPTKI